MVLKELGLKFDTEAVDLRSKRTASGVDFTTVNPKGYVPALELESGDILTETVAILQYLADHHASGRLVPACGSLERARLQAQMHFIGAELHKAFVPLFNPAITAEARGAATATVGRKFDIIEFELSDGRPFLSGGNYTIADAYLFVIARWGDRFRIDMGPWPKITAFLERIAARPVVQAAIAAENASTATA